MAFPSSPDPHAPQGSLPPGATSRYELLEKIASGGMATVYVGRQRGAEGFWRLVAIKRPHQQLLEDPTFRRMFVDEARLASKIHHPNVVPVLDVEERPGGQLLLVMDYVEGGSLAELVDAVGKRGSPMPTRNAVRIALDALAGLHAAHELVDARGRPLRLVHRDVSPHNILVGVDGTSRVADFGIARSIASKSVTESGVLRGKLAYMAPEYVEKQTFDARSDVFAAGVVLWEAISGKRLFRGDSDYDTLRRIVAEEAPPLSSVAPWTHGALDAVLAGALERDAARRTPTARAFADALEGAARRHDLVATPGEVGDHLRATLATALAVRRERLRTFLDGGVTTGNMDPALVAVAHAASVAPAAPVVSAPASAALSAPASAALSAPASPALSAPASAALSAPASAALSAPASPDVSPSSTGAEGGDHTARALVAAGIRPPGRGSSALRLGALALLVGAGAAVWWLRPLFAPAPGADGAPPAAASGAGPAEAAPSVPAQGPAPPIADVPGPHDAAPSSVTSSAPGVRPSTAPLRQGPPPSGRPTSSPIPPAAATPPASTPVATPPASAPSSSIRRNPYR